MARGQTSAVAHAQWERVVLGVGPQEAIKWQLIQSELATERSLSEEVEQLARETIGWYTWLHHDVAIEWTDDLDERVTYIRTHKPADEVPIRLAAIVAVPEARVPRTYVEAWRANKVVWQAFRAMVQAGYAAKETDAFKTAWKAVGPAYQAAGIGILRERGVSYDVVMRRPHTLVLLALAAEFAPHAVVRDGVLVVKHD